MHFIKIILDPSGFLFTHLSLLASILSMFKLPEFLPNPVKVCLSLFASSVNLELSQSLLIPPSCAWMMQFEETFETSAAPVLTLRIMQF